MASELEPMTNLAGEWSSVTDHDLAVRAKQNRELFGELYDRYVDRIYGYCYRRLQTHAAAEDATSQTFLKALSSLSGYRDDATSFRSWLFAIAHNVIVDIWRSSKPTSELVEMADFSMRESDPEELVLTSERDRELYDLVDCLPDEQAQVIHLRLGGLTDLEIAEVLGRSRGAIRVAQHRAIKRLKELAKSNFGTTRTDQS